MRNDNHRNTSVFCCLPGHLRRVRNVLASYRPMNCPECKRLFQESRWTQRYCSDACSQRARRKRKKIINQEYQERLKAQQSIFCRKDVVIVSDPLPPDEGGFSRGAVISSSSLVMMLHLGTCTPGMVIQHSGVTERVVGELNYPQDLEEL